VQLQAVLIMVAAAIVTRTIKIAAEVLTILAAATIAAEFIVAPLS
jgi:hypothetical protein